MKFSAYRLRNNKKLAYTGPHKPIRLRARDLYKYKNVISKTAIRFSDISSHGRSTSVGYNFYLYTLHFKILDVNFSTRLM